MNFALWSEAAPLPLLGLLTLLPLLAALVVLRAKSLEWARLTAFSTAGIAVLLVLTMLYYFDPARAGIQLGERLDFFGISYTAGVDSTSLLFVALVPVLTLLCLVYLRLTPYKASQPFIASVMAYAGIATGAFAALNLLQFWLWCVLELVPLLWLTSRAGTGSDRREVAGMLFSYFGAALLMMLAGFAFIAAQTPGAGFDWLALQANASAAGPHTLTFLLVFFAFAIRMPLFPFHAWLPELAARGPVVTVPVFTIGLKLGVYGAVRFILGLLPASAEEWEPFVLGLGVISMFYGALLALMQINMRRLLACSVVSHTGLLLIGLFSFSPLAIEGSLLLSVAYGLATAGMLFSMGLIYQRTGTSLIPRLGKLFEANTAIALMFLICALSTMAMPGTPGYPAAHLVLEGVIEEDGWLLALVMLAGNLLAAAFLLRAFQQIFIAQHGRSRGDRKATPQMREEVLIAVAVCALLIITGITGIHGMPDLLSASQP